MILDLENSLWKSDFDTFWQPVSGWIHKIRWFHLITVDFWAKILNFRTQTACYAKSKYSLGNKYLQHYDPKLISEIASWLQLIFTNLAKDVRLLTTGHLHLKMQLTYQYWIGPQQACNHFIFMSFNRRPAMQGKKKHVSN